MLDTNTKRRIDTARDILVGKVPDPKSQVEQITIALIYKFMDDLDAESEELGGRRQFFAGEFARFGWAKLMRSGLGGHEMLNLYAEAITRMPENSGIPILFRDIFKNAFLPYRDPETLRAFLKIIDEFEYDHSERLGDAFEYLLSVLGSQGDAGQFRTPRHIIDFIVAILDPKKDDSILDPACGTAGFLISSYKHIRSANTNDQGHSTLTPDERRKLADNLKGYDISPDMVRLSLVNMYLHDLKDPHISEYDTLTSDERWNEYADVILANPPFMSPKGGIRPHNRFSVQSKRSEVLFVDYIAEHLTPSGRAGIIVPEGIIFQSQNAHKQLRKMLVEAYLVAVVSLPAGVFNPYSGVKTSILILDKTLAKKTDHIAFFKVENDGFDLGAQRRSIDQDDLPQVAKELCQYLAQAGEPITHGLIVEKARIAEGGEYNLSGERYRTTQTFNLTFPMMDLGKICELIRGVTYRKSDEIEDEGLQVLRANNIDINTHSLNLSEIKNVSSELKFPNTKKLKRNDILICLSSGSKSHIGKVALSLTNTGYYFGGFMGVIRVNPSLVDSHFLYFQLRQTHFNDFLREQISGASINNLSAKLLYRFQIPLPPLEIQREIVAEIEGYQRVIDGARAVIENYRPHIAIDPKWPMVALGDSKLFCIESGGTPKTAVPEYWNGMISWVTLVDLPPTNFITEIETTQRTITELGLNKSSARLIPENSVIVSSRATIGRIAINRMPLATNQGFKNIVIKKPNRTIPEYLAHMLTKLVPTMKAWASGGTFKEISKSKFCELQIPIPPLKTQRAIVAEIEAEQALADANRELIERMERKIKAAIGRIWGEEED